MKYIAIILVTYISLLTISPALCGFYAAFKRTGLCCLTNNDKQCSKEQADNSKQPGKSDSDTTCCSIQTCHCNFINVLPFDFSVQTGRTAKKAPFKNDKIFSNYLPDCWHPPEIV